MRKMKYNYVSQFIGQENQNSRYSKQEMIKYWELSGYKTSKRAGRGKLSKSSY